ncbi:class I SAM-dependent methyltransferase [Aestuariimicrobium ganziense]|uniref:class I SAM-dependent methyltransferase n=1 Tax=Aestuariimicrobium ganziense TaxID=2773677 RepID=UPI001942E1EE|nr:class I SAM-dependent methyltransferase [Aestuariimicrobium ganziense]
MVHEWDATSYDALPLPHVAWGRGVLDRLDLRGEEHLLDAGCGTGRDAEAALERWPGLRVTGVDASQAMVEAARERLGDRATVLLADLTQPLPLDEPVDAVMSVAAFHWVADHRSLFANLAAVLVPGGRLVSDCGGLGNIANVEEGLEAVTGRPKRGVEFAGVDQTRRDLQEAGFVVEDVRLRRDPIRLRDDAQLEAYLATVCLGNYLAELPEQEQPSFVRGVRLAMPEPVVDYVRLEIEAHRAG